MGTAAIVLPLSIEMADIAQTDQIGQCVGLGMAFQSERSERDDVVNVEFTPQVLGRLPAILTNLVPTKHSAPRWSPRWPVVRQVSTAPCGAVLAASQPREIRTLASLGTVSTPFCLARLDAEGLFANRTDLHHLQRETRALHAKRWMAFSAIVEREPIAKATLRTEAPTGLRRARLKRRAALLAGCGNRGVPKVGNLTGDVRTAGTRKRAVLARPTLQIPNDGSALRAGGFGPLAGVIVPALGAAIDALLALEVAELLPTGGAGRRQSIRRVRSSSLSHKPDYTTFRPTQGVRKYGNE